ncbi:MAG: prepilin-type N-terminal cleavage/methylation domain-containing protein [Bacteroidales bacterium]|nr:prepilin-type N-terminal cleavage/methylation domain-containing protein [Bacteroidales bacterium]
MIKNKSFTLIELLVVIVIIGILAGVIIVSTSSSISKANFAKGQAFSNTVQQELLLNLVSEWTFDEGNAEDSWGNNDGTVTGATYQNKASGNCVYGGCYSFDGNDYITVASNGLNKFSLQSFTISEWFKPNIIQNYILLWSYDYTSHVNPYYAQHLRVEQTGQLWFGWNNGTSAKSITTSNKMISVNNWYHVAVAYASGKQKMYINGKEISSGVATDIISYYNQPVWIGKSNFGITQSTIIDDVRFYNAALSSSQIKQNYIAGLNSLLANNNISKEEYDQRLNSLSFK